MTKKLPFELSPPILYVNPPINRSARLTEDVTRSGGLGIVDAAAGRPDDPIRPTTPHGVRVRLDDIASYASDPLVTMLLVSVEDAHALKDLPDGAFRQSPTPVFVEAAGRESAGSAERAGAAGLVVAGAEGPGWVSETSGLVLLQEILAGADLPVFLRGGVSLRTAAGAVAAGAAGVVLDVHLLFTPESGLDDSSREFLRALRPPATVTLGEGTGLACRVYARVGTKATRELKALEESLTDGDLPAYREKISTLLRSTSTGSWDTDDVLLPLSEDITRSQRLAEEFAGAAGIVAAFGERMKGSAAAWPFAEGSKLAADHGTRFPVVQGPMAHVSDNPEFLRLVKERGALPFLAMGNMPGPIAREALDAAREKTGGVFGVGLIGLEVNRPCYEAHLEIMSENPPPFAILAAGGVDLAQRIERMGVTCYLHCPHPSILADALDAGLRHFVFEGCESGGHVGLLGSLDLWSANLAVIDAAFRKGLSPAEVSVLFAGGVGSEWGAAFVGGLTADLAAQGLKTGIQMGTAYLATEEAVSTCAITSVYRDLTVESRGTAVIGRTVNTRARCANSPMAARLIERERDRVRDRVPLRERKELYEKDNLGALRLASKGCAIDPETAETDCPVFCELPPEEQLDRGLYLMGQAVALTDAPTTVEKLHHRIVEQGRMVLERNTGRIEAPIEITTPKSADAFEVEPDREPIAIVGIGLRFPGANSPDSFWDQIMSGRSGIGEPPAGRWDNPDFYYDPDPKAPDKTYTKIGGFIREFEFDPLKYRIPPAVARQMDRTQKLAVACAGDALADAGLSAEDLKGKRVGVILGNSMGGESVDQYAFRVGLPRTLACLEASLNGGAFDRSTYARVREAFCAQYLEGLPEITEDSLPGELANVISGRVANVFNLEGPNFTVDAACASSMAALMNAISALRNGSIDYAVTGGVDAAMHPSCFVKFCKIGALSPDGSRPFDESANGFVMGEGAGVVVLKRVSDAMRDGDRIYATIVAVGSSSDGRGKGITAPNAKGQKRAIRACLQSADIPPESIGLIEAHGTSTPVGDETELNVMDAYFREMGRPPRSVGIGSIKSQIGHLKAAAGSAGVIKAVLSLYHRTLPPTINVKNPRKTIDWDSSPLRLLTESAPWECENGWPRRAGVSAFGFGGTNFHLIVQEHVPELRVVKGGKREGVAIETSAPSWPCLPGFTTDGEAWVIGASDAGALEKVIEGALEELRPDTTSELARRMREEGRNESVRCGFAAKDSGEAAQKLGLIREALTDPKKRAFLPAKGIHAVEGAPEKITKGVVFLFPGQGSQYPFMLRDLAERFPIVAETLREADEILSSLGLRTVTSGIFPDGTEDPSAGATPLEDTQFLQPIIITANTAILRLLEQFGVRPAAAAGHSLGEYAACVAAGVFSFRDALEAVAVRGREMSRVGIDDPGLMMSIPADAETVEKILAKVDGYVVAANKNSPRQTVISGETAAVKQAGELFAAEGLDGILIPVSAAFHSQVVAPAKEPFMKTLDRLTVNPPSIPVLSNVTGEYYPDGPDAASEIRELLGEQFASPVEWVKSLRRFYDDGARVFIECGPKRVLTNLALDTLPKDILALPTNHPKKGGIIQLMEALAAVAVEGVPVNFRGADKETTLPATVRAPHLEVVRSEAEARYSGPPVEARESSPLEALLDDELGEMTKQPEFARFLELQSEPMRSLLKSGFETYLKTILPMERTVRQVESQGMDFQPVVVSGLSAGLPGDVRFPFDRENLDDLILGRNFIKKVPDDGLQSMVEKNIERLVKGPMGEAELEMVKDPTGVIKLAGYFSEERIIEEYGVDEKFAAAMDVTARLALAAGLEALRDAGIPLVRQDRTTSTGRKLPESWALPGPLRGETGVIFASAFPGIASLVDEVSRQAAGRFGSGARKRLIEFYTGLVSRIRNDRERESITRWFTEEFNRLNPSESEDLYSFNRSFLLRVMTLASGQLAQFIKAQGPNSNVDAACASTTQAVLLARDWIRTGQAKRVLVVAADDVAGKTLLPWIGSGFLALGAATTEGNVSEAALPFDDRRHGLILGSAAVGMVIEKEDLVAERGMEALASVEAGIVANSAFHGTRLDVDHISSLMERLIAKWEEESGRSRDYLAEDLFFMSHETYSPKRGGSSAAEIRALRTTFGDKARLIPIANTKGFTGHTMGVGVEDAAAIRCLQKGMLPPIPNLRRPDPEFADLCLSRGGKCDARYVLRLAAGFGSQIVMAMYKARSREENRVTDFTLHRNWLKEITGFADPVVSVEDRTLHVAERPAAPAVAVDADSKEVAQDQVVAGPPTAGTTPYSDEEARAGILALLSDKTGYPADMLDTGLDLEADLGIDTVKQAEFISEVREEFGIPRIEGLKIADFPTIEHIIEFAVSHSKKTADTASDETAGEPSSAEDNDREAGVRENILTLLADKTGYPADMLDLDLDLEADLGIDTVKQAEFISEVREMFGIPRIEGLKIADFPTIRHIVGFVLEKYGSPKQEPETAAQSVTTAGLPRKEEEVRLFDTVAVEFPKPPEIEPVDAEAVLIVGGPDERARAAADWFTSVGYQDVRRIAESSVPDGLQSKRVGVVNLIPWNAEATALSATLGLYVECARLWESGPAFLVTVISEDGAFGFDAPAANGYVSGAVAGATKAFGREYASSRVRVFDVHPETSPERTAALVGESLTKAFPLETGLDRDGAFRAVRLIPVIDDGGSSDLASGDVVLVTGGARGITAECLKRLARENPLTFALLGRTELSPHADERARFGPDDWEAEKQGIIDEMRNRGEKPTPVEVDKELARRKAEAEVVSTIRQLKSAGSEVIYRAVDIRDADRVDAVVEEIADLCGRVDLVIHAAGIDVSRAVASKTVEEMERVISVKVDGLRNLVQSLENHATHPRRIVGFGSVSGRFGNMAQVDYSAANDGLAHALRRAAVALDVRTSIIDWAPWSDVGMATRESVRQTLEAAGIDFIAPQEGADLLVRDLSRQSGPVEVVAAGRLGPFEADAFSVPGTTDEGTLIAAGQDVDIISLIPGRYARAAIYLDPAHALLDDHRIDRAAVLPGVGGLEIMRSVAALIDERARTAGFVDVRFHSPLKIFGADPFTAEAEVVRTAETEDGRVEFAARLFSWHTDRDGRQVGASRLHHECRIIVGSTALAESPDPASWNRSVWVTAAEIYSLFFHGPAFQFLDTVFIEGEGAGVEFVHRSTDENARMFADTTPSAIEVAFQAAAAYCSESLGIMTLPTGAGALTVHQTSGPPHRGRLVPSTDKNRMGVEGRRILSFSGAVMDRTGAPVVTLTDVEMIELDRSPGFGGKVFEEWVDAGEVEAGLVERSQAFLEHALTKEEAEEYASKKTPKRALEWLTGRIAAKRVVRRLPAFSGESGPPWNTIRVANDENGKPTVHLVNAPDTRVGDLSLSHSNGLAAAALFREGPFCGVGIDVEAIEERSAAWAEDYFTEDEIAHARREEDTVAALTEMWSVKEAVLKAFGTGLRFDLKDIRVHAAGDSGRAVVELRNEAADYAKNNGVAVVEAFAERRGGVVIARALIRKPAGS